LSTAICVARDGSGHRHSEELQQPKVVTPGAQRQAVAHANEVSERPAGDVMSVNHRCLFRASDAGFTSFLRREGWVINEKKTRVYNEMGRQLRCKTPKRRVKAALRPDRTPPSRSNEVWAMDFVHDQLAMGTKLRILTVIDTFSRYVPVVDPRLAYRGADVVATLERVCKEMGYPSAIRVDQGSEFVSRDLDLWAYQNNVTLDFSRPGKPTDNAFIEAFNGRLRAECLNTHWFLSLADARAKLECWRRDYNEVRPHGAIGNKTPAALLYCVGATSPPMSNETGKSNLR